MGPKSVDKKKKEQEEKTSGEKDESESDKKPNDDEAEETSEAQQEESKEQESSHGNTKDDSSKLLNEGATKTKQNKQGTTSAASSAAPSLSTTPVPGASALAPSSSGIDSHPYARGSVIEVIHGVIGDGNSEDDWLFLSDDDEEDGKASKSDNGSNNNSSNGDEKKENGGSETTTSVRLCDVIDRIEKDGEGNWRYYVHYRDFNRRMDEWIGMERIVSPPSVGNAKARALKKQEERLKRKQARLEERNAELAKATEAVLSAPRASRRRSNVSTTSDGAAIESSTTKESTQMAVDTTETAEADSTAAAAAAAAAAAETPRMTRRLRRKTSMESDAGAETPAIDSAETPVTSGAAATSLSETPAPTTEKVEETVAIPTASSHGLETTTVGEHVVATIPAQEMDEHEGLDEASLREHEEVTKVKNVAFLQLGPHRMETWYFSPLPKELLSERGFVEVLYVCEFSLHMFARKSELLRFQARQLAKNQRHPPGNEIYRNGHLSMFEVDGSEERIYCQNLCYIAKLFLDHKTLYFDVDPFLFYVLCEVDNRGYHPVGYFSKEKYSDVGYNLACILTFPSHQRKGYGRFLIAFSYELSKKEEKVGSPEKPMSDLGQQAYKPFWNSTIVDFLCNQIDNDQTSISIMDISKKTSIKAEDIVFTLNQLGILKIINGVYFIAAEEKLLERLAKKHPVKEPRVDPSKLHWTPYVTDVKRDKFSIHSKKPSVEGDEARGAGGF